LDARGWGVSKKVIHFPDHERAEFEMELAVMESMLYALSAQLAKVQDQYKALTQRARGRS
jgi:hypothetical protein